MPDVVVRSDTALFGALPWSLAATSPRHRSAAASPTSGRARCRTAQRSDDIFTIDASATLVVDATTSSALTATNLLDTQYRLGEYNYASDFHSQPQPTLVPERHFTAGAPRGVFAHASRINFGGGRDDAALAASPFCSARSPACVGTDRRRPRRLSGRPPRARPTPSPGQPLAFTTGRGWHVMLTKATLHVGALYLDQSRARLGRAGDELHPPRHLRRPR